MFGLWSVALADDLERALRDEDLRKVDRWTARHGCTQVAFDAADPEQDDSMEPHTH